MKKLYIFKIAFDAYVKLYTDRTVRKIVHKLAQVIKYE